MHDCPGCYVQESGQKGLTEPGAEPMPGRRVMLLPTRGSEADARRKRRMALEERDRLDALEDDDEDEDGD